MTTADKLNQLDHRLTSVTDLHDQAELILRTLRDHTITGTPESLPAIDRLEQISLALSSDVYKGWALFLRAAVLEKQGAFIEALDNKKGSLAIFTRLDHKPGIGSLTSSIGLQYLVTGRYPEALDQFLGAIRVLEETGDKRGLATSHINIGNAYAFQGNHAMALSSYTDARPLLEEIGDEHLLATLLFNSAFINSDINKDTASAEDFDDALDIYTRLGDQHGVTLVHIAIGSLHHMKGNYENAAKHFNLAMDLSSRTGIIRDQISASSGLGRALIYLGEYEQAAAYLDESLSTAMEADVKEEHKVALQYLYELKKAEGDLQAALDYHERYTGMDKEMTGKEAAEKLASMKYNYEIRQKEIEAEISRLRNVELKDALDKLQKEKDRSEELLLNILPAEVAEELKEKGQAQARHFDEVSVLFTDFKGFTTISEKLSPQELVDELHECFKAYDEIISRYNIEKIKTTGDAYMAVSGLPLANANHAEDIVHAAMEICEFMERRKGDGRPHPFEVRVGVHSGSVVAGIVGVKKFAYDIWGDTVNTAARMEQHSEAGRINVSQTTYERIRDKFYCLYRGKVSVKNKGDIDMYFVDRLIHS